MQSHRDGDDGNADRDSDGGDGGELHRLDRHRHHHPPSIPMKSFL